jgi:hypothetical protein
MSKIVGRKMVRFPGSDEAFVDVTCCEESRNKIRELEALEDAMRRVNEHFNPKSGYIEINFRNLYKTEMNYCPVCGDKYKKEKQK